MRRVAKQNIGGLPPRRSCTDLQSPFPFLTGRMGGLQGASGHGKIAPLLTKAACTGAIPSWACLLKGYCARNGLKVVFGATTRRTAPFILPMSYLSTAHRQSGTCDSKCSSVSKRKNVLYFQYWLYWSCGSHYRGYIK